jgi:alkaline phosphatase
MVRTTNELALCGWTSGGHTGIMVPVYSLGAGSGRMGGVMDNTDIPKRIAALMGVE